MSNLQMVSDQLIGFGRTVEESFPGWSILVCGQMSFDALRMDFRCPHGGHMTESLSLQILLSSPSPPVSMVAHLWDKAARQCAMMHIGSPLVPGTLPAWGFNQTPGMVDQTFGVNDPSVPISHNSVEMRKDLTAVCPGLRTLATCPVPGCPCVLIKNKLQTLVVHLNDDHHWTRQQIADWLETLDIDLTIQPKGNNVTSIAEAKKQHPSSGLGPISDELAAVVAFPGPKDLLGLNSN